MSADSIIVRFHPTVGAALYDVERQCFVLGDDGQPVPADPKTGKAKVTMMKCPQCRGTGRVQREAP